MVAVGEDPEFAAYASQIERSFQRQGLAVSTERLDATITLEDLAVALARLGADSLVDGVLLQAPLPAPLNGAAAIAAGLPPEKDVEGLHPANAGALALGSPWIVPSTPAGGMEILRYYEIAITGKRAVIVGRSPVVGRPMALLLLSADATVTVCHSRTADLPSVTRQADLLVAAIGRPRMIGADMMKPGAVVLDFGTTFSDGQLVGDVDAESVLPVCSALTPVPGGTGPVTTAALARNLVTTAELSQR